MKVILVPVTPFQQNCSIVICEATRRAAVVDPGGDIERIIAEVERQGVDVEKFCSRTVISTTAAARRRSRIITVYR